MRTTDLFARQRMLAEIGDRGQRSIEAARFLPSASLSAEARDIALVYASRAGFGEFGSPEVAPLHPLAGYFRHSAAADVGLAALDVLSKSLRHLAL